MTIPEAECFSRSCKHYRGARQIGPRSDQLIRNVCVAFTEGIPDVIVSGENLHTEFFPGDHGIRYEKGEMDVRGFTNLQQEQRDLVEGSA